MSIVNGDMNPQVTGAFWVWYATAFDSPSGHRSATATAKKLSEADGSGPTARTIRTWIKLYGWEEKARLKDRDIAEKVEREFISQVLKDQKDIIQRQKLFLRRFWVKAFDSLGDMSIDLNIVLKMMEFEIGGNHNPAGSGREDQALYSLKDVVRTLSTGARSEFYRSFRKFRVDEGDPSRN